MDIGLKIRIRSYVARHTDELSILDTDIFRGVSEAVLYEALGYTPKKAIRVKEELDIDLTLKEMYQTHKDYIKDPSLVKAKYKTMKVVNRLMLIITGSNVNKLSVEYFNDIVIAIGALNTSTIGECSTDMGIVHTGKLLLDDVMFGNSELSIRKEQYLTVFDTYLRKAKSDLKGDTRVVNNMIYYKNSLTPKQYLKNLKELVWEEITTRKHLVGTRLYKKLDVTKTEYDSMKVFLSDDIWVQCRARAMACGITVNALLKAVNLSLPAVDISYDKTGLFMTMYDLNDKDEVIRAKGVVYEFEDDEPDTGDDIRGISIYTQDIDNPQMLPSIDLGEKEFMILFNDRLLNTVYAQGGVVRVKGGIPVDNYLRDR